MEAGRKAADIGLKEGAVVQPVRARRGMRDFDHALSQVDPDRLALWDERSDSPKLSAGATAGVHHARVRRQVLPDGHKRLVEDRRRERTNQDFVELGQFVELLDQMLMMTRLFE